MNITSKIAKKVGALVAAVVLAGCAEVDHFKRDPAESWSIKGPPVTENTTFLEGSFECMAQQIKRTNSEPIRITVGNIKDYTGKFSESEGGTPITQGGALMVMSALGKLGDSVRVHERFDPQVTELELRYLDRRYLGDGQTHQLSENGSSRSVPWKPYYGGTILGTDYFIVGGITELNYNVSSGGAELGIDGYSVGGRVFTMNVAADLRIVKTDTLEVVRTTSLQKQLTGYEVAADVFRFFDETLGDFNSGIKSQEPLQLGVRTTLELGVLELVGAATGVNHQPCIAFDGSNPLADQAPPEETSQVEEVTDEAGDVYLAYVVYFGSGSAELDSDAFTVIDEVVEAVNRGEQPDLMLEGHADREGDAEFNLALSRKRAMNVQSALVAKGIAKERISVVWYGESRPAVETEDGVANPLNRRVVIQII